MCESYARLPNIYNIWIKFVALAYYGFIGFSHSFLFVFVFVLQANQTSIFKTWHKSQIRFVARSRSRYNDTIRFRFCICICVTFTICKHTYIIYIYIELYLYIYCIINKGLN